MVSLTLLVYLISASELEEMRVPLFTVSHVIIRFHEREIYSELVEIYWSVQEALAIERYENGD